MLFKKTVIVTRGKPIFGDGGTVFISAEPDFASSYRPIEAKTFGV